MSNSLLCLALLAASSVTACSELDGSEPDQVNVSEYNVVADTDATSKTEAPSFDCAKADSSAEELVCSDPVLARLDKELTRLYALAVASPNLTPPSLAELKATQRGWVKGRDDCWKAEDKRECVVSAYAMRILELRQGNANARSADSKGISSGPVAFQCEGLDFGIGAVFINSDPDVAYLRWLDHGVALSQVETGSGAKYQGNSFDGTYSLWTKGDDALLTRPGQPDAKCRQEEIG
jgi:uncharacterized protein